MFLLDEEFQSNAPHIIQNTKKAITLQQRAIQKTAVGKPMNWYVDQQVQNKVVWATPYVVIQSLTLFPLSSNLVLEG